jgi:hypothetical protein
VWTTQFYLVYLELDRAGRAERLRVYLTAYAPDLADTDRVRLEAQFGESPHTSHLLRRLLRLVFG